MVTLTDPGHRGDPRHAEDDASDDGPRHGRVGCSSDLVVLEEHDCSIEEPGEGGDCASGVNASKVLEEGGQRDANPKRAPLSIRVSGNLGNMDSSKRTFWKTLTSTQNTPRRKNSFRTAQEATMFPSVNAAP